MGGSEVKARQGSDRFLTWLQETKGLEVRALSLTKARNEVFRARRGMSFLFGGKEKMSSCSEEQRQIISLVLFGGKERMVTQRYFLGLI